MLDNDMERAVRFYQERRKKFSLTLSPVGVPAGFEVIDAPHPEQFRNDHYSLFVMDYNSDREAEFYIPGSGLRVKGPGFKPRMLLLAEVFDFLQPFEAKIERITRLRLDQLRLAFVALRNHVVKIFSGPGAYTCLTRGLVFSERQWMYEKMCSELEGLCAKEGRSMSIGDTVTKFLDFLACRPEKLHSYDVLLRRGCGCLLGQEFLSVLDLTLILVVIGDLLLDLQLDDEMKQIKGSTFERTVAARIQEDVPGILFPIKPLLRLKRRSSAGIFAEADLYIACGSSLVVVDCKSYSVTREYLKGAHKAVSNRWQLVQQWINESDRRSKLIAETTDPTNYEMPAAITHIIPVVCSAFPECIWGWNEKWYLAAFDIPRVCTYPELVRFLRDASSGDLSDRVFVIPISAIDRSVQAPS